MERLDHRVLLFLLSGCLASCDSDVQPCNPHVQKNEELDVTVTSVAEPRLAALSSVAAGLPSCALDDVHIGDRIEVTLSKTIIEETGDECYWLECPLSLPSPAERHEGPQSFAGGPNYVCISPTAKIPLDETCAVGRVVWLYTYGDRPLYTSAATDGPFILLRGLTAESSLLCPNLAAHFPQARPNQWIVCADQWVVGLQKREDAPTR